MELDLTWHKHLWSLEQKALESPLHSKKIKPVNLKGNQPWIFIGMTDAEAPILWPPDAKSQHIGKNPDAGKRLKAKEEGGDRGWDGWMVSLTQWPWVWASFGRQWRTGKPGVLQSVELDMTERLTNRHLLEFCGHLSRSAFFLQKDPAGGYLGNPKSLNLDGSEPEEWS